MKASGPKLTQTLDRVEQEFVGLWRRMGSLWGIAPTMAEIHGLLYITGAALSMDEIMTRLDTSRGNVSMNLAKLVEWGLVHRVHQRGDRRDYYQSITDVWEIFTRVAAQRKRREIDPILNTLRQCKERLSPEATGAGPDDNRVEGRRRRVNELYSFLNRVNDLAQRFFESQRGLREALALLAQDDD